VRRLQRNPTTARTIRDGRGDLRDDSVIDERPDQADHGTIEALIAADTDGVHALQNFGPETARVRDLVGDRQDVGHIV
jgi:hypothetical protein